jgi:hypothetical protein
VQRERNRLIEIEIHPTPLSRAETARLRPMQTAQARLGRQKDIQRFALRNRAGTADPRIEVCVSPLTNPVGAPEDFPRRSSFEITNCDLKEKPWRPPLPPVSL